MRDRPLAPDHEFFGIQGEPFAAYLFVGPPPRVPRLWFLDRQLRALLPMRHEPPDFEGTDLTVRVEMAWGGAWEGTTPDGASELAGLCVRYQDSGAQLVWLLTNVTIPHVDNLGAPDDQWRLGLWPD